MSGLAEDHLDDAPSRVWLIRAGVALGFVLLVLAGLWAVKSLKSPEGVKRQVAKITILPDTPPPPPPPPKVEKKPEPPKDEPKQVMREEQIKQVDAPKEPDQQLKMEGAAGDGPSAFSSGRVSSEDLSKVGIGKGGTGPVVEKTGMFNPYSNYTNLAKGELQRFLGKRENLRRKRYAVEVHLWVLPAGTIGRYELVGRTGDSESDELITQALAALPAFSQNLPANMPQPIRLRVTTGG